MVESTSADYIQKTIKSAFPDGVIERVQVMTYGDDLAVGPAETAARAYLNRDGRPEGTEADKEIMKAYAQIDNRHKILKQLGDELPFMAWIEFVPYMEDESNRHGGPYGTGPFSRFSPRGDRSLPSEEPRDRLTPVMARLETADLAAVDTLIAAGIASSRAEVLRWALRRVSEHPAYAQIQDRVQGISEIKAQF